MSSSGMVEIKSRTDLRPPVGEGSDVSFVRVSPDGRQLAFVGDDGVDAGVYVCDRDAVTATRVTPLGDAEVDELSWSPDGSYLAYVTGNGLQVGTERWVGWARSDAPGELGREPGMSFAWGPSKPALVVANMQRAQLVHVDVGSAKTTDLGPLVDDGNLEYPPSIAVPSDGKHIAYSCRSDYRDLTEIWVITRNKDGGERSLLTEIPGADVGVRLFWTPKGKSVAMSVVHGTVDQSAIIVVQGLQGDGEILHHHDGLDVPLCPAWSPDGRWIALFCQLGSRAQRLALLDPKARQLYPVNGTVPAGLLHFLDDNTLAIDANTSGTIVELIYPS